MRDEELKTIVTEIASRADGSLKQIALEVTEQNDGEKIQLNQADVVRIATILSEIQHRSFMLGVQMGMQTITMAMERRNEE